MKVLEAGNGQEAMDIFQIHKNEIDLIILDLIMPKMNGISVYQHIRTLNPEISILFVSGYKRELSELPLDKHTAFLQKPFEEESLISCIKKLKNF